MEQKIKFPRSQKVYLPGKLYPNIRVAMRKVEQVPSVSFEGEEKIATPNPEIYVYDTCLFDNDLQEFFCLQSFVRTDGGTERHNGSCACFFQPFAEYRVSLAIRKHDKAQFHQFFRSFQCFDRVGEQIARVETR